MWEKADADARDALEDLAKEVCARARSICRISIAMPGAGYARSWPSTWRTIWVHFVDKGGEVSKTFRELIEEGRKVTATQYLAALRDAERYAEGMIGIFEQFADAIITLSASGVAPLGIEATGDPVFCSLWTPCRVPVPQSAAFGEHGWSSDRCSARWRAWTR